MRSSFRIVLSSLLVLQAAHAQENGDKLVDLAEMIEPIRAKHEMPAIGAAVIVDGKLVALGASGVRRHGHEAKVTVDDLWHLGSCTKAMTATLLAQQVEAGELTFETNVADAMPDLRERMHESARPITVAQLLRHRAGLPSQPPTPLWLELFKFEGTDREARTEVAEALLKNPVEAEPDARFLYSNASYMIAGAIAERAGKRDWQALIKQRLFTPLGMNSAGFGPPGDEQLADQPWGHIDTQRQGPRPLFADNPSSLGPAGTVHCTLRDWAKFIQLHLGADPSEKPLLRQASLAKLHTPKQGEDYALGWMVLERGWSKGPVLHHNGSNTMWYCVAWLAPKEKFAVLVTCNHGGGAAACDAVASAGIVRFKK